MEEGGKGEGALRSEEVRYGAGRERWGGEGLSPKPCSSERAEGGEEANRIGRGSWFFIVITERGV